MSDREPPRKPDYYVAAMNSHVRGRRIGGAWINDDGSIQVKLDPFIHLNNDDGSLQVRLFKTQEGAVRSSARPASSADGIDDDIPF